VFFEPILKKNGQIGLKTVKLSLVKKVKKLKKIFVDMLLRRYDTRQYTMNADYTLYQLLRMGFIAGLQN
jgi:hypothetical protein